jgi:hypothetical protein
MNQSGDASFLSFHSFKLCSHHSYIFYFLAARHQLGDFLVREYSAVQLRQYLCWYDESKIDLSLADTIAKLAYNIILRVHDDPWHSIKHWARLLMPLTTDELKESAKAEGLSEDGSKVDIAIRLTGHFHKYKFMPVPEEKSNMKKRIRDE